MVNGYFNGTLREVVEQEEFAERSRRNGFFCLSGEGLLCA
jgi:hypothetical protein